MKLLAVNDTEITSILENKSIPKVKIYNLNQKKSGYKADVSQEVHDLIRVFDVPTTVEEAISKLQVKGYRFPQIAIQKLYNTVNILVQYGVLVPVQELQTEFNPIIKSREESVKEINLAIYNLDTLVSSIIAFQDNHPYPENTLDTKSGSNRDMYPVKL